MMFQQMKPTRMMTLTGRKADEQNHLVSTVNARAYYDLFIARARVIMIIIQLQIMYHKNGVHRLLCYCLCIAVVMGPGLRGDGVWISVELDTDGV